MAIHPEDIYRQYQADSKDPSETFAKAVEWINTVRQTAHRDENTVSKEIEDPLLRAGLGFNVTDYLCREIFAGENTEAIGERNTGPLGLLYSLQPDIKNIPEHHVFRDQHEIIQHAKAYQHLLYAFAKQAMTEDLIKKTHQSLTKNIPILHEGPGPDILPESYGGIYRSIVVGAGTTNFSVPKFVPLHMSTMCEDLKNYLITAETNQKIDPFL